MPRIPGVEWSALVLLVALLTLPFLGKPFHIDDTFFLRVTENIVANPLDPYAGELDWWDRPLSLFRIDSNPPLLNYYLAPFAAVSNFSEVALHFAMIPFHLLLAAAMLVLGRRFTAHRWWALAFTMTSVGVVVSGNVMRDVPAAAFGAAAIAAMVTGTDRSDRRLLFAGCALAGCAMLTKYSALLVLPILAAYPILQGRWRLCLWILVALALPALFAIHNLWVYGEIHFLAQLGRGYNSPGHGWQDNLSGLPVVAGSLLFLLPALWLRSAAIRDFVALGGSIAAALAAWWLVQQYLGGAADWQYLLWATTGSALLFLCALAGLRGAMPPSEDARDAIFLCFWLAGPLLLSVAFVPFQAVRHLLPALPPMVLLAFRHLEMSGGVRKKWDRTVLGILLASQVAIASLVARADADFAAVYRDFASRARETAAELVGTGTPLSARGVWFLGHWGWMYYAEQAGLQKLHSTGPYPSPGDFVVVPEYVDKGRVLERVPRIAARLEQVDQVVYSGRIPIRTMHPMGAGFYALFSGSPRSDRPPVPYRFGGSAPLEIFDLYRLEKSAPPTRKKVTPRATD
jgi:hypothetical protein